jgi:LacI family transcriptional regulator
VTKRVCIKDVAKYANVSTATVSRVFNKSGFVSEQLCKKVLKAADELGYTPYRIAQSLRKGTTKTIGFLIPDIANPFFASIVKGANYLLESLGYVIVLCSSSGEKEKENELLDKLYNLGIDGLLVVLLEEYNDYLNKILSKGIPIVVMDDIVDKENVTCVASNNYEGMKKIMRYLISSGHKSFAYLSGNPDTFSAGERLKAFEDCLSNSDVFCSEIIIGEYTYESGFSMIDNLSFIPDAVVCGNDLIAYGAIRRLEENGYSIPGDISVTGFDDILFSNMIRPPLTTVKQNPYLMGKVGASLIIKLLSGDNINFHNKVIMLDTELIIRGSCNGKR